MATTKCVLTGATGHIGYPLLLELLESGENPTILIRKDHAMFDNLDVPKVRGDVTDPDSLVKAFEGADVVYHLAGMIDISKGHTERIREINVGGTRNVVEACRKCGVRRLVYMGSVDTYVPLPGHLQMTEKDHYDPNWLEGDYAKTKAEATNYVLAQNGVDGLETVVCQPAACAGPYDYKVSSIGVMVRMYMQGVFNMKMDFGAYNFVDVRDVAHATHMAASTGRPGECYILSGYEMSVSDFVCTLARVSGKKPPFITLTKRFISTIAPGTELYYRLVKQTPLITPYSIRKLCSNCNFSNEKAKRDLDLHPMSVEDSMRDMMAWIREHEGDPKETLKGDVRRHLPMLAILSYMKRG